MKSRLTPSFYANVASITNHALGRAIEFFFCCDLGSLFFFRGSLCVSQFVRRPFFLSAYGFKLSHDMTFKHEMVIDQMAVTTSINGESGTVFEALDMKIPEPNMLNSRVQKASPYKRGLSSTSWVIVYHPKHSTQDFLCFTRSKFAQSLLSVVLFDSCSHETALKLSKHRTVQFSSMNKSEQ